MNFTLLKTPAEMKELDQTTLNLGLPELLLMENAARSIWQILQHRFSTSQPRRILLFMGSGNNGGDAAALARNLQASGDQVLVLHSRPLNSYKASSGQHIRLARKFQVPFAPIASYPAKFKQTLWAKPDLVIDGLLGTGFTGQVKPLEQDIIQCINSFTCPIIAIDIPSGLSGINGKPSPVAVQASLTVSFAAAKPGLMLATAKAYVGELIISDIGIPQNLLHTQPSQYQLLPSQLPPLDATQQDLWHKGIAGHSFIIGGSAGLMGAPQLSALAALRSGCGLVSLVLPHGNPVHIAPDIMTLYLGSKNLSNDQQSPCHKQQLNIDHQSLYHSQQKPSLDQQSLCPKQQKLCPGRQYSQGHWQPELVAELATHLAKPKAIVLGPGLGTAPATLAFLQAYLNLPQLEQLPPHIIDASALELLAQDPSLLGKLRPLDILTPHPGEAAKLLGCSSADIQAQRLDTIVELQKLAPCTWILKGANTLISSPNQPITISPFSVPNLAIAGSGDVLAGCLAYYLIHYQAHEAACLGVLRHALAGLKLTKTYPQRGNLASDIANALSEII